MGHSIPTEQYSPLESLKNGKNVHQVEIGIKNPVVDGMDNGNSITTQSEGYGSVIHFWISENRDDITRAYHGK
jgi:hypothetical protein